MRLISKSSQEHDGHDPSLILALTTKLRWYDLFALPITEAGRERGFYQGPDTSSQLRLTQCAMVRVFDHLVLVLVRSDQGD